MPIFIMRQWVRHRTASLNEYSGRYSIMSDEFYRPTGEALAPQSAVNNQGRGGEFTEKQRTGVEVMMEHAFNSAYAAYDALVTPGAEMADRGDEHSHLNFYEEGAFFDETYPGLARELARTVMPVANYTELYWKQDLHNLLHLIKLRRDSHAQKEIQAYAEAVYTLVRPLFPLTVEAWEDYVWNGVHLSRMDAEMLLILLHPTDESTLDDAIARAGGEKAFAEIRGYSVRELRTFREKWKV
jgi:thymidylate synthase (FAD)